LGNNKMGYWSKIMEELGVFEVIKQQRALMKKKK